MKRKLMLLVAILALVSSASFAQLKYGGGLSLGTEAKEGGTGLGINARVDYSINEKFSIAPNFTFWFPGEDQTLWQLNADVHYTFAGDEALSFYGIGGLNYTHYKFDGGSYDTEFGSLDFDYDDNSIGLNLGVGANMNKFFGEVKYDTSGNTVDGQIALTVGVLF